MLVLFVEEYCKQAYINRVTLSYKTLIPNIITIKLLIHSLQIARRRQNLESDCKYYSGILVKNANRVIRNIVSEGSWLH